MPFNPMCVPRYYDHPTNFGLISPQMPLMAFPRCTKDYFRPSRNLYAEPDVGSTVKEDKNIYQINVDVKHFAPQEISVKTVDGYLIIEAKHEEKEDEHGFISRSFTRRYALPERVNSKYVISKLSLDGILSIIAPLKPTQTTNERIVPIVRTGPVKK